MEVLNSIPVKLDAGTVLKRLRLRKANRYLEESLRELIAVALPIARPKALYEVSYLDCIRGDVVDISGVRFTSRVLRVNLENTDRVFPYIATCGRELGDVPIPSDDLMKGFCWDAIEQEVLGLAIAYLQDYLGNKYSLGQMSHMNPGSLADWPVTQQKELFAVFGDVEEMIGVKMTKSFMMSPLKTVSGIYFPTDKKFESCQLCPRESCVGRRSPYDTTLAEEYWEARGQEVPRGRF